MEETARDQLLGIAKEVPAELFGEFIAATDFTRLTESVDDLTQVLQQVGESTASLPSLTELRRHAPEIRPVAMPWDQGYEFAAALRDQLGLNGHLLADDQHLATAIATDEGRLRNAILVPPKPGWEFDAMVGTAADGNPVFATAKRRGDSQRFVFCRAMFEYFTRPESGGAALVTRAYSDRQRANRAFAAEFLAPHQLLHDRIKHDTIAEDQIDDLAEEFGVSPRVIQHQVENHHIARIVP